MVSPQRNGNPSLGRSRLFLSGGAYRNSARNSTGETAGVRSRFFGSDKYQLGIIVPGVNLDYRFKSVTGDRFNREKRKTLRSMTQSGGYFLAAEVLSLMEFIQLENAR